MLTGAFALERFQPIRRGNAQIVQAVCSVQHSQLAASERLDLYRQAARNNAVPDALGLLVGEAPNHGTSITPRVM